MRARLACSISIMVMLASLWLMAQVKDFRPVTEAMLRNPAPGDWLNWRRTDNAWGFSPLDQINRQNVQQLQLAWSWAMDDSGAQESAPLVYDGVMYLPNPRGVIQALDAATGDLIWEYRPGAQTPAPAPSGGGAEPTAISPLSQRANAGGGGGDEGRGIQRNIAIYGDKVFGTTNDAHIVAVEARTGKLVWDTKVADSKLGYSYTSGPIVVRGKVIAGITGCTRYKEDVCFITGHDAATGREVWRTSTIARPGEPGGDTWGDLPLTFRAGGDAWIPGSYDPEANLVYWATAQAKPWARVARGTDGDALYTNSTLALDPDTGKMKWYYQHLPGETQDMDEVFENLLIDVGGRKSLFKMGKLGILWQLDRTTGAFVHATDIGYQNIVQVNPQTGKVTYRQGKIPELGVEVDQCPSTAGFKSWRAMAYSPQTNVIYIPLNLNCEKATFGPVQKVVGGGGVGPVRRRDYKHPESKGNLGEFMALNITTGRAIWTQRTPSPSNTAALPTAGGVVFGGDWDRHVYAYDAATGKILWQARLPTSAQGFPITYLAKGKQYVAVPAGIGGGSWSTLLPPELAPEIRRPNSGNTLVVFALPDASLSK
ncbi:MAG: pyrrolo-quinoline quinone [Acidobacteria bacterium]|nr:MAG: pyrrolo-quinoline quinone [Acidobacteriota bacterium]